MKMFRQVPIGRALVLMSLLSSPTIWAAVTFTTPSTLSPGVVGTAYTATLAAKDGTAPYIFTLAGLPLPGGLTLASSGAITGTPTTAGTVSFLVQVTDSAVPPATPNTALFTITITAPATALAITTSAALPDGMSGVAYSQALAATGGTPPYVWSLASGTLPVGLTLSSSGTISGMPTAVGNSAFSIQVKDSVLATIAKSFSLSINTPTQARNGVLSQVASGGGWKTSIYLVNTSTAPVPVTVKFWSNTGTALTLPLAFTQVGGTQILNASSASATVPANATVIIESTSQAAVESDGWAEVVSIGPITGYGVFHFTSSGGVESEGTVPMETAFEPSFILPYDGMDGFVTGVALTNLVSTQTTTVIATVWSEGGTQLATKNITLPRNGHTAFMLADVLPSTISNRGIIEFRTGTTTANITGLGLRVNPSGGFTSIPTLQRP